MLALLQCSGCTKKDLCHQHHRRRRLQLRASAFYENLVASSGALLDGTQKTKTNVGGGDWLHENMQYYLHFVASYETKKPVAVVGWFLHDRFYYGASLT